MKKLILILTTVISTNAFAIEPDKRQHLELSAFLGAMSYVAYSANCTKKRAYVFSILTVLTLGAAKEIILDDRPDGNDMKYNALGAIVGPLLFITF